MIDILSILLVGLLIGVVARFLFPGPQPMGWVTTILLGIGGAFVAGLGGQALGIYAAGEAGGFIAAVIGALLLLFVYRTVQRKA